MRKFIKILMLLIVSLSITACSSSKNLSEEVLKNKLNDMEYIVKDITSEINDSSIKTALVANDNNIRIEYYVYKSEDSAEKAYNIYVNKLKEKDDKKVKETKTNNYNKATQTTKDFYNEIIRKDNVLIYTSNNVNYKSKVKSALKKIGY